jgi:hypothetical protein
MHSSYSYSICLSRWKYFYLGVKCLVQLITLRMHSWTNDYVHMYIRMKLLKCPTCWNDLKLCIFTVPKNTILIFLLHTLLPQAPMPTFCTTTLSGQRSRSAPSGSSKAKIRHR